jgi:hypothetical protein
VVLRNGNIARAGDRVGALGTCGEWPQLELVTAVLRSLQLVDTWCRPKARILLDAFERNLRGWVGRKPSVTGVVKSLVPCDSGSVVTSAADSTGAPSDHYTSGSVTG